MAEKITKANVIEFISNMTVLELSELVKELEDKFGVKASAPVMAMAGMAQAPGRGGTNGIFSNHHRGWG